MEYKKIINVGILAHVDAGKTTLTEQMLYQAGALRSFGSVDKGTAQTDGLQIEQERGISVRTASACLVYGSTRIHLIDTPGHADFLSEVERALSVLDYGILVISAVEGVQAQTELLLAAAKDMGLPLFVFVNKLDRQGSRGAAVLAQLKAMGLPVVQMNLPQGEEGPNPTVLPAHPEELVLMLEDEALMEALLAQRPLEGIGEKTAAAIQGRRVIPVLYGSSKLGVGVQQLLAALDSLCIAPQGQGALCGRVFKVDRDPVLGKGAHVRLFAGEIKNRQSIYLPRLDREEKCSALRLPSGRKTQELASIGPGEIGVLYGLAGVRAGDIIGRQLPTGKAPTVANPLLSLRAEPENKEELPALVKALTELAEEDPLLDLQWIPEKRELRLTIAGTMQREVLAQNLGERYGLRVRLSQPSVIYKETPKKAAEGFDAYTMPKPCWAVLRFFIEPLPRGSGLVYESCLRGGDLPYRYQNHVQTAVPRALQQGLKGWALTDVRVRLIYGQHHHVHTHPLDFFLCTPLALMDGLQKAGTDLLEPYYHVYMGAQEALLGKAIGLVLDRRGSFDSPVLEAGRFTLVAALPVAECMDLPQSFAALTGGRGSLGYRFSHYAVCPPEITAQRERIGVNPLDRAKYILEQRSALGG